ncbi:folylpolyglutamate synthase, mitochondrial-like [Plodia interpunctella]|uniref:folylpolyglutamate synthase, mitochondrial-like n=1 Tax=Plodia interpunctella TaxID=58824 RepID=UPI002367FFA4|nr:folylpolyglutamate synthase, mitochondrial-like [Plodia interpunctella]
MISISSRFCSVVHRLTIRMGSNTSDISYESAVCKLNLLQSNKQVIDQIRKKLKCGEDKCKNIEDMRSYLERTGVPLSKLDQLSVIHVAGTKGKGSTSAMCESILRQHGFRTGFYSSPHLVAVRERIRLHGKVISEDVFAGYFHRVYGMLDATKTHEGDMPGYFAFLTVLAFNTFLAEKVDVAVIEVGIGGIVDYTNVLRKVPVVGITALGLDHTAILGETLGEIAAAKAGVMKRGCRAYSAPQPPEAMAVLQQVADELQCPLTIAPKFESYNFPNGYKMLQCNVDAYKTNASLAIQLSHAWMQHAKTRNNILKNKNGFKNRIARETTAKELTDISNSVFKNGNFDEEVMSQNGNFKSDILLQNTLEVPYETWLGLKECRWPGRYHVVEASYARFYLDGAHTKESMDICAEWFKQNVTTDNKILIFGATGDRNSDVLMKPLTDIAFKRAYFVVPAAYKATNVSKDDYSTVEQKDKVNRCELHEEMWRKVNNCETIVSECMADVLVSIKRNQVQKPVVLVTGSLHLVGAALSILDPNLCTYS